jgi:hypothetical protein
MKMKTIRNSILCFVVLFLAPPLLHGQDPSKYRQFTLGMSLTRVLERTDQKMADVKVIHSRPALIQELTWWPSSLPRTSYRSESVEQILFSFCGGELYRMSVTYDRKSTEGLTTDDMVNSISVKYGPATSIALAIDSKPNDQYEAAQNLIASWENSQYSCNLVRSSFSDDFQLVIYSKRANAEVETALAEAVKLDKEEEPQRKAELQKKETDDLEVKRQKNQKDFRP